MHTPAQCSRGVLCSTLQQLRLEPRHPMTHCHGTAEVLSLS